MDCGPDNKAFRRLNAMHLLLIGRPYPLVLLNSRVNERTFRLWIARFNDHIEPLYLSPYSPDFNPIERFWQHLKSHYMAGYITKHWEDFNDQLYDSIKALLD